MSDTDAEFLDMFRAEAAERLDTIVDLLLAVEQGRADPETIDELFREAHTIKGVAGMVGLDDVQALAHALENVLAGAREAGSCPPELVEPLLRATDGLRRLVAGEPAATGALLKELEEGRARLLAAEAQSPVASSQSRPASTGGGRPVRVQPGKLDRLVDLVGEAVLEQRRLEHALAGTGAAESDLVADAAARGDRLLGELKDAAIQMRTLPLSTITGPFARAVRDLAAGASKEIELVITGGETELDRVILEGLSDPLVHLLRNAVAHGIEPPEERERSGKPRPGRIHVRAEQRGGRALITVADDGRGAPVDAVERAANGSSLTDVLTQAGFSTAGAVTDLSGRGVGLDAVKAHVEALGGNLDVRSEPGRGLEVALDLPLTLALLEVLLVERGASVFAVPLAAVEEAIAIGDVLSLVGRPTVELRGRTIPFADLLQLVGGVAPPVAQGAPAIVVHSSGRRIAAACDRLLGKEEVVVKSLGLLSSIGGYLGAAVLGDGRIALVLDPVALVRATPRERPSDAAVPADVAADDRERSAPKLLVVEDSFTVRELQRSILEAAGYWVETAKDGREALERVKRDDAISLVVTDVEMPEMDGLELTRAIRAHPARSALPVVVVTTRASDEDRALGLEAGADAYMAKTRFDQQALLETVERLVGR